MVCLFVGHVVVTCNHTLLDRVLTGLLIYGVCLLGIVEKFLFLGLTTPNVTYVHVLVL